MIQDGKEKPYTQGKNEEDGDPLCTCKQDPFAALPPELHPTSQRENSLLHKITCPGCGLVYWTNRMTDLCVDCEKQANG